MLADLGTALLMRTADATGGMTLGEWNPQPRFVFVATAPTQTPLPDWLDACPLDSPTGVTQVAPTASDTVKMAYEHVHALASELPLNEHAQAVVDRLVQASARPLGRKRLLTPRVR